MELKSSFLPSLRQGLFGSMIVAIKLVIISQTPSHYVIEAVNGDGRQAKLEKVGHPLSDQVEWARLEGRGRAISFPVHRVFLTVKEVRELRAQI